MKWEKVKLGDTATFINGYPFKPNDWSIRGKEIIRIQNLTKSNGIEANRFEGVLQDKYLVKKGDLLISWSGTLGVYEWDSDDAWLNQHIFKVVFDKKEVNKNYFKYLIQSKLHELEQQVHGATMKHITKGKFDAVEIPLPPLHIQEQIADTLDKADALRRKDQELLYKYDELAQAIFYDMFGDPVRNERGWEAGSIEEYFELINGDRSENYPTTEDYVESGVPFFGTNDMKEIFLSEKVTRFLSEEKFNSLGRGKLKYDDLVITLRGSLGNICLFRSKKHNTGFINAQMMILRGKKEADPLFSTFLFRSKEYKILFERITGGSAVPQITSKQVSKLPFIYPPKSKQREFSQLLIKCLNSKNILTNLSEMSFFKILEANMF